MPKKTKELIPENQILKIILVIRGYSRRVGPNADADAILDRLIHNAYRINLKGESMRKKKSNLTKNK
jgi:DNA replication protein DnaC